MDHDNKVNLENLRANVKQIHVDGLLRTKNDIVNYHLKSVFAANNFDQMVKQIHLSRHKFEQLSLFKSMKIGIDVSKTDPKNIEYYDVSFKIKEQSKITGAINTLIGTNEGTIVGSIKFPNLFGRGERLSTEVTYGSKNTVGVSVNILKPLFMEPHLILQGSIFQNCFEFPWSKYKEVDRGIALDYMFPSLMGLHNIRWEGVWREVSSLSSDTAFEIRAESGHTLKSSIKHTWQVDKRDSKVLPSMGYLIKSSQELAGLGGDVQFFKEDSEFQYNLPLLFDSTLQLSIAGGFMKSLGSQRRINLTDRFFIGGPLTLRGFNMKGVGPHVDGCALGANMYWNTGLHLYTPLPFRPGKGGFGEYFRTHFFLNAGNLSSYNPAIPLNENLQLLTDNYRMSYGTGIVLRIGSVARLEVNYCIPVLAQIGDSINPGLQIGIGVSFL